MAMSVVLTRFASLRIAVAGVEGVRVGLGSLPNIMAGIVLGPLYGAISGAASDVIGFMMSPMGAYMPHFTVTAALLGALPGAALTVLGRGAAQGRRIDTIRLAAAIFIGIAVVSWGLTPYFLHSLFGLKRQVTMPPRILSALIEAPLYTMLIKAISDRYGRMREPDR